MTLVVMVLQVKTSVTCIPQYWIEIPRLLRNLSRDLIGPYRMLVCLLAIAKEEAAEDEGKGDPKPQTKEGQHSREGYLGTEQRLALKSCREKCQTCHEQRQTSAFPR